MDAFFFIGAVCGAAVIAGLAIADVVRTIRARRALHRAELRAEASPYYGTEITEWPTPDNSNGAKE